MEWTSFWEIKTKKHSLQTDCRSVGVVDFNCWFQSWNGSHALTVKPFDNFKDLCSQSTRKVFPEIKVVQNLEITNISYQIVFLFVKTRQFKCSCWQLSHNQQWRQQCLLPAVSAMRHEQWALGTPSPQIKFLFHTLFFQRPNNLSTPPRSWSHSKISEMENSQDLELSQLEVH